jgi:hypothetical protein
LAYDAIANPPTAYDGKIGALGRTSTIGVPVEATELLMHGLFVAQGLVTRELEISSETVVSTASEVRGVGRVYTTSSTTTVTAKSRAQRRKMEQFPPKIPPTAAQRRVRAKQQTKESLFTMSAPTVATLAASKPCGAADVAGAAGEDEQRSPVDLLELARGSPASAELFKKININTRVSGMGGEVSEARVGRVAEVTSTVCSDPTV